MAEVQNPIIGRSKNKFANAIFSTWKGKNILRSKPLTVANPQTEAQMAQRAKFSFLVHLAKTMQAVVKAGMREMAVRMTEFNAFVSANINNGAVALVNGSWVVVPEYLVLSKGSLAPTEFTNVTTNTANKTVNISYDNTVVDNQTSADKVYIAAGNSKGNYQLLGGDTRNSGSIGFQVSGDQQVGDVVDIYMFFTSPDGRKVSDVRYINAEFE